MRLIGSHVSMKAPDFYLGSVQEMLNNSATTLMLYTGAPQNSKRLPVTQLKIEEALELCTRNNIDNTNFIVHAPYLINLANSLDLEKWERSVQFLLSEMKRAEAMHIKTIVLHPGSHLGAGIKEGLLMVAKGLDYVLSIDETHVRIAIESMAGKGFEVGRNFEELAFIIEHVSHQERVGVCLDTCHLHDSGFNVHDVDKLLQDFDNIIGLNKLWVIHLNDSKNECGSHSDRHENIGYGKIGFTTLDKWYTHPLLHHIPFILETPYINKEKSPYKKEIMMLNKHEFDNLDRLLW